MKIHDMNWEINLFLGDLVWNDPNVNISISIQHRIMILVSNPMFYIHTKHIIILMRYTLNTFYQGLIVNEKSVITVQF
jgi:hypothetical protein